MGAMLDAECTPGELFDVTRNNDFSVFEWQKLEIFQDVIKELG